jgi:hypothetical protein
MRFLASFRYLGSISMPTEAGNDTARRDKAMWPPRSRETPPRPFFPAPAIFGRGIRRSFRAGQYTRAAAEADGVVGQGKPSGLVLYNAACVQALAAEAARRDASLPLAEREKLAEQYAARAVALLVQAQRADFFKDKTNVGPLRNDSDLKALRDRGEFKRLLGELGAKQ